MKISILGSTGSIGNNTLSVIANNDDYQVIALTAASNVDILYQQCLQYTPNYAVMVDFDAAEQLQRRLQAMGSATTVLSGVEGLETVASLAEVDIVVAAIVGGAGLLPTLASVKAGKRVLLANKESLVMSGELFMQAVKQFHATLLPVDSEHNAVFQCLPENFNLGLSEVGVTNIILTASGGPFRQFSLEQLQQVTPEQACQHPNWKMGRKISVDSATMMNKGLEVIEAHWLFAATQAQIQVVIHPQSIVHSMVAYKDGSVLAQLGRPDMRTPIAYALAWPQRINAGVSDLDISRLSNLSFEAPNLQQFPCLNLAYQALESGGLFPVILNAANEVAVELFLQQKIGFTDIAKWVEFALEQFSFQTMQSISQILEQDKQTRELLYQHITN